MYFYFFYLNNKKIHINEKILFYWQVTCLLKNKNGLKLKFGAHTFETLIFQHFIGHNSKKYK